MILFLRETLCIYSVSQIHGVTATEARMANLMHSDLLLAVALGVGLGVIQIGWMKVRRQKIDTMQWLSIGLVVVSGIATMLTSDPRFVMLKPSVIYCIVAAYMLRPGWMTRYLPPIAVQ